MVLKRTLQASVLLAGASSCAHAQGDDSFLHFGKSVVEGHPQYSKYRPALERFPDLATCEVRGFLDPGIPFSELHRVFRTSEEFEVCHFWLFSQPSTTLDDIRTYLRAIDGDEPYEIRHTYGRTPYRSIQGSWNPAEGGVPFGGYFQRRWIKLVTYGAMLSVNVQEDGQLRGVDLVFTSE